MDNVLYSNRTDGGRAWDLLAKNSKMAEMTTDYFPKWEVMGLVSEKHEDPLWHHFKQFSTHLQYFGKASEDWPQKATWNIAKLSKFGNIRINLFWLLGTLCHQINMWLNSKL